jgi:hypothetical protein
MATTKLQSVNSSESQVTQRRRHLFEKQGGLYEKSLPNHFHPSVLMEYQFNRRSRDRKWRGWARVS